MSKFDWKTHDRIEYIKSILPQGWEGGTVFNSGGGIYLREWYKELPSGEYVTVGYNNIDERVGMNVYESKDDKGYGPMDSRSFKMEGHTDMSLALTAVSIMHRINLEGLETFEE